MTLRRAAAALAALASIPLAAAMAVTAVRFTNGLLSESFPGVCGKRDMVLGLLGACWGSVLFALLLGQAEWVVDRIACRDQSDSTVSNGASTDSVQ